MVPGLNGRAVVPAPRRAAQACRHTQEPAATLHLLMEGTIVQTVPQKMNHAILRLVQVLKR